MIRASFARSRDVALLLLEGARGTDVKRELSIGDYHLRECLRYLYVHAHLPDSVTGYRFLDREKAIENLNNLEARLDRQAKFLQAEEKRAKEEMHNLNGR